MAKEQKKFDDMTRDERIEAVRQGMAAGGSNKSVAKALGTTHGTIAGIRFKNAIPSLNRSSGGKNHAATTTRSSVMSTTDQPTVPRSTPIKPKLAASEKTQCKAVDETSRRCGYERMEGSDYCILPQHQLLSKKKPARH